MQSSQNLDHLPFDKYRFDDISTIGHLRLQKERQMLKYYRVMANEFPKLKGVYWFDSHIRIA